MMASRCSKVSLEDKMAWPSSVKNPRLNESTEWWQCLFCQKGKALSTGAIDGVRSIKKAAEVRVVDNITKKITPFLNNMMKYEPKWHRSCFASYTSKGKLKRILSKSTTSTNASDSNEEPSHILRSAERDPKWNYYSVWEI